MEVNIEKLKKLIDIDINGNTQKYSFLCKNSSKLNIITKLSGYICLHRRNYKTILIDQTGWIYCEITNGKEISNKLKSNNFLKKVFINNFNIIIECVNHKANIKKKLVYLQFCLDDCEFVFDEVIDSDCEIFGLIKEKTPSTSIVKTKRLTEMLMAELDSSEKFIYPFKLVNKGLVSTLLKSQYETTVRANIKIEFLNADGINTNDYIDQLKCMDVTLVLISNYLFFYSLLHYDVVYELHLSECLEFSIEDKTLLVFVNDKTRIFESNLKIIDGDGNKSVKNTSSQSITGILLSKDIYCTRSQSMSISDSFSTHDMNLMTYFDLFVPEIQYKLSLNVKQTTNTNDTNESYDSEMILYFDSTFYLYQFCAIPGSLITIRDVYKSKNNYFKSNSCFHVLNMPSNDESNENIEFFNGDSNQPTSLGRIFESINSFNCIFDYYNWFERPLKCTKLRIFAQLLKIYDLTIQLMCIECRRLYNLCTCNRKDPKIEFNATLLIDDHTSELKVNYSNKFYDLNGHESFFKSISTCLLNLLKNVGQIKLTCVPSNQPIQLDKAACVIYEYLISCTLNNYFLFEIVANPKHIKSTNTVTILKPNEEKINYLDRFQSIIKVDCCNIINFDYLYKS